MIFQDENAFGSYWEAGKMFLKLTFNQQRIKEGNNKKNVNDYQGT